MANDVTYTRTMGSTSSGSSGSSGSEAEWEDVETLPPVGDYRAKDGGTDHKTTTVEIVLSIKGSTHRGRNKNALERAMEAFERDLRQNLHKTSLLCLVAQGLKLSRVCSDTLLQARLFSLVPRELHINSSEKLAKLLKWFAVSRDHISSAVREGGGGGGEGVSVTQMLVGILRVLGLRARLVLALNPISFRRSTKSELLTQQDTHSSLVDTAAKERSLTHKDTHNSPFDGERSLAHKDTHNSPFDGEGSLVHKDTHNSLFDAATNSRVATDPTDVLGDIECPPQPGPEFLKFMERLRPNSSGVGGSGGEGGGEGGEVKSECVGRGRPNSSGVGGSGGEGGGEGGEVKSECVERGRGKRRSTGKRIRGGAKKRKVSYSDTPEKGARQNKVGVSGRTGNRRERKPPTTASETSPYFTQSKTSCGSEDSDSDFQPLKSKSRRWLFDSDDGSGGSEGGGSEGGGSEGGGSEGGGRESKERGKGKRVKRSRQKSRSISKRAESNTSGAGGAITGVYDERSSWAEVYMEGERRYVCLHIPSCSVDQPKMCEKHCPFKLSYIIAIETRGEGERERVCDVTGRYASEWCTGTRKLRLRNSASWWAESLQPFTPDREEREREEEEIMNILYSHPLPTSISDYKSHPLYVLRRHLLKFEAIYPVDSEILGYCKGEPVFSRDCVFTLHTRETWLKEGKVVKKGEEPYKVVKARPKKEQSSLERDSSTVEVFGVWQTELYIPPPVVDGVVPKNEYGNVELFQPSMLPSGASHIRIAGIQKVARKLGISHAPAMVGWDFHSGHCCPVIDGIVVAEENREVVIEGWRQEEQMMIEKEMKKRETKVLERWRRMVRGALIRERVNKTYSLT